MMQVEASGLAMVICAPSGAGKSTLIRKLLQEFPGFSFSVSYTTRAPRPGEVPGRDYHFVQDKEFLRLAEKNFFAEWAKVHGNYYGTPLQKSLELMQAGNDLLFDIDIQGARQLKANLKSGVFVFILPPSRSVLEARLAKRGTDDAKSRQRRLDIARQELQAAEEFDYWILNQDLQQAYQDLRAVYLAEKCRPRLQPVLLQKILASWDQT